MTGIDPDGLQALIDSGADEADARKMLAEPTKPRDLSHLPRVLNTSTETYGRELSSLVTGHGRLRRILWDDGTVTVEGDGNPDVITLPDS